MKGYLSLVLHAHLPYVRHPEHEKFLEENWLFEAITETYVPLLRLLDSWHRDGVKAPLTMSLTPTLCSMLLDPLLQTRYLRHVEELIELAEKEIHRTLWEPRYHELALFYRDRLTATRDYYAGWGRDLVQAFRKAQDRGQLEIITSAATHAVLPLLASHPASVRAQILVARDHYRSCFGKEPRGIWLPECAYFEGLETFLEEANLRWFVVDTHGVLHARPRPRYAMYAPILTPNRVAVFGRDPDSATQVWSRHQGYPGDPRYREFYRDAGFDLDYDYVKPYLPATDHRGFTGIKYYRITGSSAEKAVYDHQAALRAADEHAAHFLNARMAQIQRLAGILDRPPLLVSPYDAELFGHWWYEGPEFLDFFFRKAWFDQEVFRLITPEDYLDRHPSNQVAAPAPSSWGAEGHLGMWLNEKTEWIYPHLHTAQERMTELANRFPQPSPLETRALKQAARELLLAQASDWPFIMCTGTSPDYARQRLQEHLLRFNALYQQLITRGIIEVSLGDLEARDNIFPEVDFRYWAGGS